MLVSIERVRLDFKRYLSLIFILILGTPHFVHSEAPQRQIYLQHKCYQHFIDYFCSLDENTDLDDVVDNLIDFRLQMLSQGIECATLKEICQSLLGALSGQNLDIETDAFKEFIHRIEIREAELSELTSQEHFELVKHKHKHKDKHKHDKNKHDEKELKMGAKGVFGFIKMVAGGLMCLIPVPGAQALGISLIGYGLNDMIDDAREQGENEAERQREQVVIEGPDLP